jgi:hypothetical protein
MTHKSPYVLAALSIIILLVIASTAGCTSSSTSPSSSPQASGSASTASSGGQAGNTAGYPRDSLGFDPDPSVMPRYTPSVRTISINYTDHGYTAFQYETKDTLQQVTSFYQTSMAKLGYTPNVSSNTTKSFFVKYDKNGRTVIDLTLNAQPSGVVLSKFSDSNHTLIGFRLEGPNYDGS